MTLGPPIKGPKDGTTGAQGWELTRRAGRDVSSIGKCHP